MSFSSAENTLYGDVKILTTFRSQCTENPPFRFLWDTRYTPPLCWSRRETVSSLSHLKTFRCDSFHSGLKTNNTSLPLKDWVYRWMSVKRAHPKKAINLLHSKMYAVMSTPHIQPSPADSVVRQKVAEFQTRQGVERIFRLKSTLSHFGRGSGGALWNYRPAPVSKLTGVGRSSLDVRAGAVRVSVDDQYVGRCPADVRAGSAQRSTGRPPMCVAVTGCTWQPSSKHHVEPVTGKE